MEYMKKRSQLGIQSCLHNYGWMLQKLRRKGRHLSRMAYLGGGGLGCLRGEILTCQWKLLKVWEHGIQKAFA
jgi:hypothetical protein